MISPSNSNSGALRLLPRRSEFLDPELSAPLQSGPLLQTVPRQIREVEALAKELKDNNLEQLGPAAPDQGSRNTGNSAPRVRSGSPFCLPWVLTEYSEQRTKFERNPYYWHVDSKGQQLPYIDTIINNRAVDRDAQVNATIAGQVDIAVETDAPLNKMAMYVQNADRGGYRVFTTGSFNWPLQLFLNHDFEYQDPNSSWQKLVADPIIDLGAPSPRRSIRKTSTTPCSSAALGRLSSTPKPTTPRSPANCWTSVGMDKLDDEKYRLDPAGKRFSLRISFSEASVEFSPVAELLKQQFKTVGLRVDIDPLGIAWDLFNQRKAANELMATLLWDDGPAWGLGISEDYTPGDTGKGGWSPLTWRYFTTNGKDGRKPPPYCRSSTICTRAERRFQPVPGGQGGVREAAQLAGDERRPVPMHRAQGGAQSR